MFLLGKEDQKCHFTLILFNFISPSFNEVPIFGPKKTKCNKPSCGVSRLPTFYLAKKLSKYRLKPPKCRDRGPLKKPEKRQE